MKLPEICIKHPVFATVLSLLILLVGVFSYNKLETNLYPSYNTKSATVSASISGASAKYLSDNVAVPLINAAKSLPDIKNLVSDCQQGSCKLTINFKDSVTLIASGIFCVDVVQIEIDLISFVFKAYLTFACPSQRMRIVALYSTISLLQQTARLP